MLGTEPRSTTELALRSVNDITFEDPGGIETEIKTNFHCEFTYWELLWFAQTTAAYIISEWNSKRKKDKSNQNILIKK